VVKTSTLLRIVGSISWSVARCHSLGRVVWSQCRELGEVTFSRSWRMPSHSRSTAQSSTPFEERDPTHRRTHPAVGCLRIPSYPEERPEMLQTAPDRFDAGDTSDPSSLMRGGMIARRNHMDFLDELDLNFLQPQQVGPSDPMGLLGSHSSSSSMLLNPDHHSFINNGNASVMIPSLHPSLNLLSQHEQHLKHNMLNHESYTKTGVVNNLPSSSLMNSHTSGHTSIDLLSSTGPSVTESNYIKSEVDVLQDMIGTGEGGIGKGFDLTLDDIPFETSFDDERSSVGSTDSAADALKLHNFGTPPSPSMLGSTPPDPFSGPFEGCSWPGANREDCLHSSAAIAIPGTMGSRHLSHLSHGSSVDRRTKSGLRSDAGTDGPARSNSSQYSAGDQRQGSASDEKHYIGAYSPDARRKRIQRFMEKRTKRVWTKKVKYDVRKNFADSRMRVKGRFVKKEDEELLRELMSIT